MAEYIGSRISLVSKSDIRYVGTLHEINSQDATVALENVSSFGTEGRKGNPADEIPPSDSVYEYIVFRGTDVKDLRIEEGPAKENKPPNPPDDPAILRGHSRPAPHAQPQQRQQPGAPQGPQQAQSPPGVPPFAQQPQYPPFYPPQPGWGRGGPPGPGGFPPMPYGAPPGWYPGPGQGFPPGPFPPSPYGYPPGPQGQFQHQQPQQQPPKPSPIGPGASKQSPPAAQPTEKPSAPKTAAKSVEIGATSAEKAPTPPTTSKPTASKIKEAEAVLSQAPTTAAATRAAPPPGQSAAGRVVPAVPLQSPALMKTPLQPTTSAATSIDPAAGLKAATQAATAAVAAAMAKLPPAGQTNGNSVENLTKKVNEMRTSDHVRAPRHPGTNQNGGFASRGARGPRGGARNAPQPTEVPKTDFDFESANAKFNKEDLVKEAIASSPLGENPPTLSPTDVEIPVSGYNKKASFFDNISSESKDRLEAGNSRPGGREWRGEEQKKNVETFGQGSVDNGYRGGYRGGRGRGRGRGGYRGRGVSGNGQPRGGSTYRGRDAQAFP